MQVKSEDVPCLELDESDADDGVERSASDVGLSMAWKRDQQRPPVTREQCGYNDGVACTALSCAAV